MSVTRDEMIDAKADAQAAILRIIEKETARVTEANMNAAGRASAVRDLALAFRYVVGGQQPGAVSVESK
ncbi:hypothetical protein [Mycetocola miduiensis]|uniref:Uncharacterized protein n=1 Tax=Mycetocola miduiensis TaxID=995034 RepID=A0A1I5AVL0_9MICO|nr:hypothetical protein [Mycetocola miduiensis]SFN66494.1 hypothetical protein SAMN05216219_1567 [Mycetocola miduiensis]